MGSSDSERSEDPPLSPVGRMRYYLQFPEVIPHYQADSHVLLTRSPLAARVAPALPLDLHVLSLPPAFNLSHDQTLQLLKLCRIRRSNSLAQLMLGILIFRRVASNQ